MRVQDTLALLGDARSYQVGHNGHHTDQRKALEKLAHVCVDVCKCIYMCVCAHVYICVFVHCS